jgi:hypothetical protein
MTSSKPTPGQLVCLDDDQTVHRIGSDRLTLCEAETATWHTPRNATAGVTCDSCLDAAQRRIAAFGQEFADFMSARLRNGEPS